MRAITRLLEVYARPKNWPADDAEVARRWANLLDGVTEEQLGAAVTAYLRGDHNFMPKPGQLRAIALRQGRRDAAHDPSGFEAWRARGYANPAGALMPCPVCGRAFQAHPRVAVVHDHDQHVAVGVACTGCCDDPTCLGTYSCPPTEPPAALSAGAVWQPPHGWTSDLPARARRLERGPEVAP